MKGHVPTSVVLHDLLKDAPPDHVSLGWVMDRLQKRSFGLLMLLLALLGLVPGLSLVVGVLLALIGFLMILARQYPILPSVVANRRLSTQRFAQVIARILPLLRRLEKLIRPRWPTPFETTKRVVGSVVLLLALSLVGPIPFSHVIPCIVIMAVALAYLEEDGIMLSIALALALISLSITAATVWATIAGIELLNTL